ncbi:MAG: hypothetical protein B5M48_01430 [Candidatus Omnitrophica bacterium 4484_213]|nr:MAG: hypothetical protein B5M48_01430 [Candidatus Omnitrophica bacterium 4484_213]
MRVKLINYTSYPQKTAAIAGKLCYAKSSIKDLEKITPQEEERFIEKIIKLGHLSVIEHSSFTFAIEGISRVTSHQLVRHRLASFSQQSQRYVKKRDFEYIIPPTIKKKKKLRQIFEKVIKDINNTYAELLDNGIPVEDARFLLPNACETKIIVTMNARELRHFFKLRCAKNSQWEIREMANLMLKEVRKVAPVIFKNVEKGQK